MSEIIDPPEYYFTGINFNPAFYNQDIGNGISQSTANTLYLRKTVPDTATALETFNSGIITPSITSTGPLNIVVPVASATDILNVAVGARTIVGQIHHYSDGDNCVAGAGVHLNNGLNNNSATNIHNGTGANPSGTVNIMTGTSNSGIVTIGSTSTTTNVKGNSAIGVVGAGTVTINRPITAGYVPSDITSTSQIGYIVDETITATSLTSGAETKLFADKTLSAGVWLITFSVKINSASSSTLTNISVYSFTSIGPSVQGLSTSSSTQTVVSSGNTGGIAYNGSSVFYSSGAVTYNVAIRPIYSGGALTIENGTDFKTSVRRVRIA